ncbi:ABC transporter permease [Demequina lignilytica]|uniref:Sugar ABC transporter permease n=1 Tax=Demequina lignilytica TaxID=3051663 RepID=A0AB35MEK7_9MICO|nr:hypothetical protein [Demequina sp. SYSU T0a273]MDN4482196.1 hypothetical protein [Demequina sp. SYSU T0a273]
MGSFMRRATGTLIIPVGVFAVVWALAAIDGASLFSSSDSLMILARTTAVTMLTTMALAINLNSGRFDFSLGAMALASSTIGATIAINVGGGFPAMAAVTLAAGALLGAFSGLLYVTLRISPLVSSLGVTLLFEGLAFTITGGGNISFTQYPELVAFGKNLTALVIVIVLALVGVYTVFDRSRFGSDYRALITGQHAAVSAGVKEKGNAIATYAVSGGLMGVVGLIQASGKGLIEAGSINFSTIGIMFTAFLPMFVGGYIGRYSNDKLGYLLGALSMSVIGLGYSALRLTSAQQSLITAFLLVAFLIFLSNEERAKHWWRRARLGNRPPSGPTAPPRETAGVGASA